MIIPRVPNLDGDEVSFVRLDAKNGDVINHGFMHISHVHSEQASGTLIRTLKRDEAGKVTTRHRFDKTKGIFVEKNTDPQSCLPQIRAMIVSELMRTDRYFLADALDNISTEEQEEWRTYRRMLRAISKRDSVTVVLKTLQPDPKGFDAFMQFRTGP